MAKFNQLYQNKTELITALGTIDYVEFDTDELFEEGTNNKSYVYVPSLNCLYIVKNNGRVRLIQLADLSLVKDRDA